MRFLERIQSHISSVLGSEQDCRSSVQSQMQEPLLPNGKRHVSMMHAPHSRGPWPDRSITSQASQLEEAPHVSPSVLPVRATLVLCPLLLRPQFSLLLQLTCWHRLA